MISRFVFVIIFYACGSGQSGKCRYTIASIGATDTGLVNLFTGDEWKLMEAVATVGPVSAAIDASQSSFRFYDKGLYASLELPTDLTFS